MQYCGDVGVYYFRFCDQADEYRDAFIRTIKAASKFLSKHTMSYLQLRMQFNLLVEALAELEVILPVSHNTLVMHLLLHVEHIIKSFGNFHAHNMLDAERFHVLLKKFGKGTRDFLLSIANRYGMYCETELWRFLPGTHNFHNSTIFVEIIVHLSGASTIKAPASSLAAPQKVHPGNLQGQRLAQARKTPASMQLPPYLFLQVYEISWVHACDNNNVCV